MVGLDPTGTTVMPNNSNGIQFDNSTAPIIVLDNVISGNLGNGIYIEAVNTSTEIKGNIIGLASNGLDSLKNNSNGIDITSSSNVIVGGNQLGDRNIISSNESNGIRLSVATNCHILGNFIGTDISGSLPRGNFQGINLTGASTTNNLIGDETYLGRNVISGNEWHGVFSESAASGTEVYGNYIGTDSTGLIANGNGRNGVSGTSSGSILVGGDTEARRNIIGGNGYNTFLNPDGAGAWFSGISLTSSTDLTAKGNYIGLGVDGSTEIPNANYGIWYNQSDNIQVGGDTEAERNVISANGSLGLNPQANQVLSPEGATSRGIYVFDAEGVSIQGNYIGTDATGSTAKPNLSDGVVIVNSSDVVVGGSASESNLISGNTHSGLYVFNSTNVSVTYNILGLGADGTTSIPNGLDGIYFNTQDDAEISNNTASGNSQTGINLYESSNNTLSSNVVGLGTNGTSENGNIKGGIRIFGLVGGSQDNLITLNTISNGEGDDADASIGDGYGVYVGGNASTGNDITQNSIYCNNGLSINLQLEAPFYGTIESGNIGKEAPFINPAISTVSLTRGEGDVGDTIEIYSNPNSCGCDAENYLGFAVVEADGSWEYVHSALDSVTVSALARDTDGNTSQLSCKESTAATSVSVTETCEGVAVPITIGGYIASQLRWQVSLDEDFSTFVLDSVTSADGITEILFETVSSEEHFVRIVSQVSTIESDTSATISWTPIEAFDLGTIELSSNSICAGEDVTLSVENDVLATYAWSEFVSSWVSRTETANEITISPSTTTSYAITSSQECVTGSDTVSVEVSPVVTGTVDIDIDTNSTCGTLTQTLSSTVSPLGAGATYDWVINSASSGETGTELSQTFVDGDVISLIVTPDTLCASATSYESNEITISIIDYEELGGLTLSSDSICAGDDVTLTVENDVLTSYSWIDSVFAWNPMSETANSITITPTQTARYAITSESPCVVGSDTVSVVVTPLITGTVVIDIDTNSTCGTLTQTLSSTVSPLGAGATYDWVINRVSSGETGTELSGTFEDGDVISLAVTPDTICPAAAQVESNFITIEISDIQNIGDIQVSSDTICAESEVTLSVDDVLSSYVWNDSVTVWSQRTETGSSISISLTETTSFTVEPVTGACAEGSDTVTIVVNQLVPTSASISVDTNDVCSDVEQIFTADLTNVGEGAVLTWRLNGTDVGNETSYSGTFSDGDEVELFVTTDTVCATDATLTTESISTIVTATQDLTASVDDYTKCLASTGGSITLSSTASHESVFQWYLNDVLQSSTTSSFNFVPTSGDSVSLSVYSTERCVLDTVSIDKFVVDFSEAVSADAGEDISATVNEEFTLTATVDEATSQQWSEVVDDSKVFESSDLSFTTSSISAGSLVYVIDASNTYCSATDTVIVTVSFSDIVIANALTPNDDGNHDTWEIKNVEAYPTVDIKIFNIWGSVVFEQIDEPYFNASGWDGTRNGEELPTGTYYYILDLKDGSEPRSGYVNILK